MRIPIHSAPAVDIPIDARGKDYVVCWEEAEDSSANIIFAEDRAGSELPLIEAANVNKLIERLTNGTHHGIGSLVVYC